MFFKTMAILLTLISTLSFANSYKLQGTIAAVNPEDKTIMVDSIYGDHVVVKILPNTEIEMDNCGVFGTDKDGTFKDLTPGTFVEMKLYLQNTHNTKSHPIATEIEIECYKNRAY